MSHPLHHALIWKVIVASPTLFLTVYDTHPYLACIHLGLIKLTLNILSILDILWNWIWAQIVLYFYYFLLHVKLRLSEHRFSGTPCISRTFLHDMLLASTEGYQRHETWKLFWCILYQCYQGHFHGVIACPLYMKLQEKCFTDFRFRKSVSFIVCL